MLLRGEALAKRRQTPLQQFAATLVQIIEAGLRVDDANPYFVLFDNDDRPWPKFPWDMGRDDILEYIHHCWPQFASAAAVVPDLTEH